MSLVEEFHAAHKARLARINARALELRNPPVKEPVKTFPEPDIGSIQKPIWFSIEDSPPPPELYVQDIIRAVCKYFDITATAIKGTRRTANVVYPRQIAMYLARHHTTRSFPEIGRRLGGRDHTTALHGARVIQERIKSDWMVAYDVAHIEATL